MKYNIWKNHNGFYDPWKSKIFDLYPNIPKSDVEIHKKEENSRWIYDKRQLDFWFGNKHHMIVKVPYIGNKLLQLTQFMDKGETYIIKPRVNLRGMSKNTYFVNSPNEAYKILWDISNNSPIQDFIIYKPYKGEYFTSNVVIYKNEIINSSTYSAEFYPNSYSFKAFFGNKSLPKIAHDFAMKAEDGFYCLEGKGEFIFDAHKRLSSQFYDLDSLMFEAWNKNNPLLINNLGDTSSIPKISRVYRVFDNYKVSFDKELLDLKIDCLLSDNPNIFSINLCFENNTDLSLYVQDEYSYRYMFINGTDLDQIEKAHDEILKILNFERIIK